MLRFPGVFTALILMAARPAVALTPPRPGAEVLVEAAFRLGIPRDYASARGLADVREPQRLVGIGGRDALGYEQRLTPAAARAWARMRAAAAGDGIDLRAVSTFRSVEAQLAIVRGKLAHGQTMAEVLRVSAAPGYSEHHSGRAVDITTPGYAPVEEEFERSPAFSWLLRNAKFHHFRLSYPRGNAHAMAYEPWHWCWQDDAPESMPYAPETIATIAAEVRTDASDAQRQGRTDGIMRNLSRPQYRMETGDSAAAASSAVVIDFETLAAHRTYLLKVARLELRDEHLAEDAVSDVLTQAYERRASFAGRSSLRTWLTAILKNHIIDLVRKQWREEPLPEAGENAEHEFDRLFDASGHYARQPMDAGNPAELAQQDAFLVAVQRCVDKLPRRTGQLFVLREVLGSDTDELCKDLQITPSNVWVQLYRARMMLRTCLENVGFGRAQTG